MQSIGNAKVGRIEDTYCVINYRHVREGLTSLNNSSGDFENESKAVRDQMQIRFISVKPDRGRRVKSSVQPLNVNTAGTASTSAPEGLLLRGYTNPYWHSSLSRDTFALCANAPCISVYSRTRKYLKIVLISRKLS